MQRLAIERGTKYTAAAGVVARQGNAATHGSGRDYAVPYARDLKHRSDRAHPAASCANQPRRRAIQAQLGGWYLACAELILESIHLDALHAPILIAQLHVEE